MYGNRRQTAATEERRITNARHAIGNRNARQTAAIGERRITNARHTVGNRNARQTAATAERRITNARHAVGNGNACQTAAISERRTANARHGLACMSCGNHNFGIRTSADAADGIRSVAVLAELQTVADTNRFFGGDFVTSRASDHAQAVLLGGRNAFGFPFARCMTERGYKLRIANGAALRIRTGLADLQTSCLCFR